jgi:hypothetical protein
MFIRAAIGVVAALTLAAVEASPAMGGDDSVYLSLRNRIGLLHYCQEQGLLDEKAAADSQDRLAQVIKALPPASDAARGDALEQAGMAGKWGQTGMPAEQQAQTFGLSLKDQCSEWSE